MTFSELRLVVAIQRAGITFRDSASDAERLEISKIVASTYADVFGDVLFPFARDDVWNWGVLWRKNKDNRIKADVAYAHGCECFWMHRQKGACSDQAEVGHLVPRSGGSELSVANCVIECSTHNRERRERTIEEYLRTKEPGTTPGV